jgi:hypothetical protein
MENFKLDLTKLTPVAEADRVKGNWYVVSDEMDIYGFICQWHSKNNDIGCYGGIGAKWKYWFLIPPNLPGFPVQELPDEFELKLDDWEFITNGDWTPLATVSHKNDIKFRRIKPKLPSLSIPEQTESERREWLQAELEKLNK